MGKTLKNLIRLHKFRVDEKRRALGVLFGQLNDLEQKLRDLETQLVQERQLATDLGGEALYAYGRFHQRAMMIREQLQAQIAEKEKEVDAARDEVNEAFRELKVYEEAEKNRLKKEQEERTRKENIEMDEIAQNLYRQNNPFNPKS